jgi:hypothetical protein
MNDREATDYAVLSALDKLTDAARTLTRLYEEMTTDFGGFASEAEYQEHAADAFAGAQESIDAGERMP